MKASIELISIGNELLSGRTLNAHAQTLGAVLAPMGLSLTRDTTIPDDVGVIQSAVREAFNRVDVVVVSGGLGPTVDDITRDALADLFDRQVIPSASALEALEKRVASRGRVLTPAAKRMALILEGAVTLLNSAGAAPGQQLKFSDPEKTLFVLPGPPNEFAAILTDHMVPWFKKTFPGAVPLELRVLTTQGIGESDIVTILEQAGFQYSDLSIGFYPGFGRVEIRLNAPAEKKEVLERAESTLKDLLTMWLV